MEGAPDGGAGRHLPVLRAAVLVWMVGVVAVEWVMTGGWGWTWAVRILPAVARVSASLREWFSGV